MNQSTHQKELQRRQEEIGGHGTLTFRTVHQNSNLNEQARDTLENSNRILFLGFGYHEMNLSLLGMDWVNEGKRLVAGTALDIGKVRYEDLKKRYPAIHLVACNSMEFFNTHHALAHPDLP